MMFALKQAFVSATINWANICCYLIVNSPTKSSVNHLSLCS